MGAPGSRIRAASVNGFDVFQASGYLVAMMEHRFPTVIGRDFSGVVDEVGDGRTDVAVGDEVIGFVPSAPPLEVGTFAESLIAGPAVVLAPKPSGLAFDVAAAIPLAGATALGAVDAIKVSPGDTVLVVGATGGVGILRGPARRPARRAGHRDGQGGRGSGLSRVARRDRDDRLRDRRRRRRHPEPVPRWCRRAHRRGQPRGGVRLDGGARPRRWTHRHHARCGRCRGAGRARRSKRRTSQATRRPRTSRHWPSRSPPGPSVSLSGAFPLSEAPAALAAFGAGTRGKIVLEID